MNILIVGLGSIAKKHIEALKYLNLDATIYALRSNANASKVENVINVFDLDSIELAQKINNLMEEKILQHPAEYLWMHRRFKSTLGKSFYK